MTGSIITDPLIPLWAVALLGGVLALAVLLATWRRLPGWWLRGLAALAVVAALLNPSIQREAREALSDIVLMVVDESASQALPARPDQTARAAEAMAAEIGAMENTELRTIRLGDAPDNGGTRAMEALSAALAELPRDRVAGAILVSDGRIHDAAAAPDLPAPLHLLMTGREQDWDRRLVIEAAPAFAIIGEPITLQLRIEDQGAVPPGLGGEAPIEIAIDGGAPERFTVPVGRTLELPLTLEHGGRNVVQFSIPEAAVELTARNNAAVVQINGVRDRLRVLLVSGEPHQGERVWRNLLKSDSSVDLVHFTILRPPEKQDGVPVDELSLIAFPTRELFLDKIDEFDLIVFDRYRRRGILPMLYLDNVRQYAEAGGAVLVAAGPDFAGADSLYRSPLGDALPGTPTARVFSEPYLPRLTETGARHPVTRGLDGDAQGGGVQGGGDPSWGRWFQQVELDPKPGAQVVMNGADDSPLLILDRVGEGRVALLGSDHAWLWSRGYEGGGPQLELLRRLAHWLMREPELEEEALEASAEEGAIRIERRTLAPEIGAVAVTRPDGSTFEVTLDEAAPGRFTARVEAEQMGLYRLAEGETEAVIAMGPSAPREFEETVASGTVLEPAVTAGRGGIRRIEEGVPDIRRVREGRVAAGRGWIGITPREAYRTLDVTVTPLLRPWLFLLIAAGLMLAAWLREGRRRERGAGAG